MKKLTCCFFVLFVFSVFGCAKFKDPTSSDNDQGGDDLIPQRSTISGRISANGSGLENVSVFLEGIVYRNTKTDVNGNFIFTGLEFGHYTVKITNPDTSKYNFSSVSRLVIVESIDVFKSDFIGTLISHPDPPEINNGSIVVEVKKGTIPLPNINVRLIGSESRTAKTESNGQVIFSNLPIGNYVVSIEGFENDITFSQNFQTVAVLGNNNVVVSFLGLGISTPQVYNKASIVGIVYEDTNKNGQYDFREPVFTGLTVILSGHINRYTTNGKDGRYAFANLSVGNYKVSILNPYKGVYLFDNEKNGSVNIDVVVNDDNETVFYVDFRSVRK